MTPFALLGSAVLSLTALIAHTLRVTFLDGYHRRPTRSLYDTRQPV